MFAHSLRKVQEEGSSGDNQGIRMGILSTMPGILGKWARLMPFCMNNADSLQCDCDIADNPNIAMVNNETITLQTTCPLFLIDCLHNDCHVLIDGPVGFATLVRLS